MSRAYKSRKSEIVDTFVDACDVPNGVPQADLVELRLGLQKLSVVQLRILLYFFTRNKPKACRND